MAHRESIQDTTLKTVLMGEPFFWAVSSSVGYTCRNKKEDVLLVQFFLNCFIDDVYNDAVVKVLKGTDGDKNPFSGIPKALEPDGSFGGKTWGAIKWFQKKMGLVVDGMISESDGTNFKTPKQGKMYTIHALNMMYNLINPQYYYDIRMDGKLPSPLCQQLSGPLPDLV